MLLSHVLALSLMALGPGSSSFPLGPLSLGDVASIWSEPTSGTTHLNVSVESNGSNTVFVLPGDTVFYEVIGLLSDDNNEGLALMGLDLSFDGGDLPQADEPTGEPTPGCDNPMINFAKPWGITNPAGFGGTIIDGELIQVGGAQNTIKNTPDNAPFPIGPVLTGVAQPGGCGSAVLVTGSFSAPLVEGEYHLVLSNLFANVIVEGEDGSGLFWATQAAVPGTLENLTINVTATGACCTMSGGCVETDWINCQDTFGVFAGPGLTCNDDGDGDGVANACDHCPNSPAGSIVRPNGCVFLPLGRRPGQAR